MLLSRKKWYGSVLCVSLVGYVWASLNLFHVFSLGTVCLFKRITHFPCPSCGSTRFIEALLRGDWKHCLHFNPLGIIILLALVVTPLWCVSDLMSNNNSFRLFYQRLEHFFKQKRIYLPCLVLILLNWAWNIYKGL